MKRFESHKEDRGDVGAWLRYVRETRDRDATLTNEAVCEAERIIAETERTGAGWDTDRWGEHVRAGKYAPWGGASEFSASVGSRAQAALADALTGAMGPLDALALEATWSAQNAVEEDRTAADYMHEFNALAFMLERNRATLAGLDAR